MTFAAPFALAWLAAVTVAWWLRRTRTGAPVVRVASLLAFRGAADARPTSAPRRRADVAFALTLAAMALLAVAAAGPGFGAAGTASVYVVVDRSVSMSARTCDAERRADDLLRDALPGAVAEHHDLGGAADGLPGSIAEHLERARREGYPGLVLVTDTTFPAISGVACVGPSQGATANVSIAGVALDGGDAVVSLRNYGRADVHVSVKSGAEEREVDVPEGGVAAARFPAPPYGARTVRPAYEIVAPRDDLAADDRVEVFHRGGTPPVTFVGGAKACPRLAAAVRAASPSAGGQSAIEIAYRAAPGDAPRESGHSPRLVVAPTASTAGSIRATAAPRIVRGDEIVGHGDAAAVLPASGTSLAATGTLDGGEPLWSCADGVLLAREPGLAVLAIDPEDPRSDWHRDPSFPVLVATALESLADGPDRIELLAAVPASESDVVREARPTASAEDVRAVARTAFDAPLVVRPAPWIAGAAALLLLVAALLPRR